MRHFSYAFSLLSNCSKHFYFWQRAVDILVLIRIIIYCKYELTLSNPADLLFEVFRINDENICSLKFNPYSCLLRTKNSCLAGLV